MSRTLSGKSTDGSDPVDPAGRPGRVDRGLSPLRRGDVAAASVMAAVSYLAAKFTAPTGVVHAAVFFAASLLLIVAGRFADRIWEATLAPALRFSAPQLCILSRMPFRLLGGGIAFTVALLGAKRADIIAVKDVPVIDIFSTGVIIACGYYAFVEGWKQFKGNRRPGPGETTEGNER